MNEIRFHFTFSIILIVFLLLLHTSQIHAQTGLNKITFENYTGDVVSVKVIGTNVKIDTLTLVDEESRSIDVEADKYYILIRYGSKQGEYHYAKGDTFSVVEKNDDSFMSTRILLRNKPWIEVSEVLKKGTMFLVNVVRSEDYAVYPASSEDFEKLPPTYSEVLSTYPKGTILTYTEGDIYVGDNDKIVFHGNFEIRDGKELIFYYGTKLTVIKKITTPDATYLPGDKVTVDKDMRPIKVRSWE